MKQHNAAVTAARIVFNGIPQNSDDGTDVLEFMGMYKSKYVASRVYKYEMDEVQHETIDAFEKRFRSIVSEDGKLRREMRRYRELGCRPSLQLWVALGDFGNHRDELVDCWTFSDKIAALARSGRSMALLFSDEAKGNDARVEVPASFLKLLAKYQFSFRFAVV